APALPFDNILGPQRENIGGICNQLVLEKRLALFFVKTFDIERVSRNEMAKPLYRLRGANESAGTAADGVRLFGVEINFTYRMTATSRTNLRKLVRFGILRPLIEDDIQYFRNDVACPLNPDCVADTNIHAVTDRLAVAAYSFDVVFIV